MYDFDGGAGDKGGFDVCFLETQPRLFRLIQPAAFNIHLRFFLFPDTSPRDEV